MGNLKRRTRNSESIATTVRYEPETYEKIRKYAFRKNMSIGRANEELVMLGLEKAESARQAS